MIKGAKYKRNSKKQPEEAGFFDDFYLEWKTIQFIERRKARSITRTVVPDGPIGKKCGRWKHWLGHDGKEGRYVAADWYGCRTINVQEEKEDHVVKQTTLTTDEYEWVCLVGGNSHQHQKYPLMIELDEEVLTCHILDYYDLIPPEGNTYVREWQDGYYLGPEAAEHWNN